MIATTLVHSKTRTNTKKIEEQLEKSMERIFFSMYIHLRDTSTRGNLFILPLAEQFSNQSR